MHSTAYLAIARYRQAQVFNPLLHLIPIRSRNQDKQTNDGVWGVSSLNTSISSSQAAREDEVSMGMREDEVPMGMREDEVRMGGMDRREDEVRMGRLDRRELDQS